MSLLHRRQQLLEHSRVLQHVAVRDARICEDAHRLCLRGVPTFAYAQRADINRPVAIAHCHGGVVGPIAIAVVKRQWGVHPCRVHAKHWHTRTLLRMRKQSHHTFVNDTSDRVPNVREEFGVIVCSVVGRAGFRQHEAGPSVIKGRIAEHAAHQPVVGLVRALLIPYGCCLDRQALVVAGRKEPRFLRSASKRRGDRDPLSDVTRLPRDSLLPQKVERLQPAHGVTHERDLAAICAGRQLLDQRLERGTICRH
eukprot:2637095-Prymnesium_polylepis.1